MEADCFCTDPDRVVSESGPVVQDFNVVNPDPVKTQTFGTRNTISDLDLAVKFCSLFYTIKNVLFWA
jgi:hypothetical protein